MASQGPPGPDVSQAPLLVGVTSALHLVSFTLYGARIWTRAKPNLRLYLDDYFITLGVLFDLISYSFLMVAVSYGVGRHNYYVPDDQEVQAEKWLFLSQPTFPWSLAFSKMSIAWMLLRIQRDRRAWVWSMYAIMVFVVLTAINTNAFQFSLCKPLWAVWDHSNPDAVCMDPRIGQTSIYVNSAFTILTDLVLSLAPITFIIHIQRPLREKIVLAFVMGLGIFATSASIAKTFMVESYGKTGDTLMDTIGITTWSMLEMQLAIIAACIPCLKQLFERFLRRWGLISTHRATGVSRSGYLKQNESRSRGYSAHINSHQLSSMRSQRGDDPKCFASASAHETDSVESGEMPIMKPSRASLRDFDNPASPTSDASVYFKTAIKATGTGDRSRPSLERAEGGSGGYVIQKETTVSVRTEPNPRRGVRDEDIV
ncbi:hypothetical protein MMYC01_209499 [Madurella mycetomatis]|uniref:Rhodopsin domain-containing protein n=1 Tax=Madurella mycetomatis TaxID=100816 RepID=A0A175VVV2_9PEZI|nr:hypothetical protein MMYC01_209499 [Madurella mycetomatis]